MDELSDVGLDLVARLEATVNEKVHKAIALRIRTKVLAARSDPDSSSRRWPFELIQNAHDAGARAGREGIRPICTPELPGGHTGALDFFLAGEAYDLIAADDHSSGAGICGKDENRIEALRSPDHRKMHHVVMAVARTVACRCSVLCDCLGGSAHYRLSR